MPNWYQNEKFKKKVKDIAKPALLMAPLAIPLGFMGNKTPVEHLDSPPMIQPSQPATQPTTKPSAPTTIPSTRPTSQPTTKPTQQKSRLVELLKDHEGYDLSMYPDSEGIPTIGIGFNLQKPGAKSRIEALGFDYDKVVSGKQSITDAAAMKLFTADVATAKSDIANVIPDLASHPQAVQDVLTDMMFNLGINRFSGFQKMIAAVNAKDYAKAADEMKNSKWYTQVARRGPILENLMRSAVSSQPTSQPVK